jgi:hypothetical protein
LREFIANASQETGLNMEQLLLPGGLNKMTRLANMLVFLWVSLMPEIQVADPPPASIKRNQ